MNYQEFITEVQRAARLQTYEEAAQATEHTLSSLAQIIPKGQVPDLCCDLPKEVVSLLSSGQREPDCLIDKQVFMGWLMNDAETTGLMDRTLGGLDASPDDAGGEVERRITAVLSVLKAHLSRQQRVKLAALLPDEVRHWFRRA